MSPLKKALKIVGVNGIIFILLLVVAEISSRLFVPVTLYKFANHVESVAQQKLHFIQTIPNVKREVTYTSNAFGFRSVSMASKEKPVGKIRIFCLGASTTQNSNQETNDIWCSLIEKKLIARGITNVETAALGWGGWRAVNLLDWTVHNALEFHPDIVITLMGINDLTLSDGRDEQPFDLPLWRAVRQKCKELLHLCRLGAVALQNLRARWRGTTLDWSSENIPHLRAARSAYPFSLAPMRDPDPIESFSRAMGALVAHLREAGIKVVVLGQPVIWRPDLTSKEASALWFPITTRTGYVRADLGWLEKEMHRYNARQHRIATMYGADYVDLDRFVPKDLNHFIDDCHFTDLGNEAVASAILPKLLEVLTAPSDFMRPTRSEQ